MAQAVGSKASPHMAMVTTLAATGWSPSPRCVVEWGPCHNATMIIILQPTVPHSHQGKTCAQGTPITSGTYIRLQHQATRRWLHSHLFKSPLTHNQEVSAFGDDDNSDTGDVWQLEIEGGGKWTRDEAVRLKHKDTGMYLVTHKYGVVWVQRISTHASQHTPQHTHQAYVWATNQWASRGVCGQDEKRSECLVGSRWCVFYWLLE